MIGERGLFMNTMHIEAIEVGPAASNCYLLWGEAQEALVVDPGAEGPQIVDVLRRHELKVAAYTLTHAHIDHIGALAEVVRIFPAPVGMHPSDLRFAFTSRNTLPPFYPTPAEAVDIAREYAEGQEWTDGGLAYRVLHTPGHSPGGVCFYFEAEKVLVGGDCLFAGSIGRTDLPGGDTGVLMESLRRLAGLPADTRVLPGHGPQTTIAEEKRTNPFLRGIS